MKYKLYATSKKAQSDDDDCIIDLG